MIKIKNLFSDLLIFSMEGKTALPPISTLTTGLPVLSLDIDTKCGIPVLPLTTQNQLNPNYLKGRPTTFSTAEDISILKAMRLYLGNKISTKIPWSFWQLYRRFTGSQRSDSSLYHHWNGAMIKKYGSFIRDGKIDECIRWAESALSNDTSEQENDMSKLPQKTRQLIHTKSHQEMPSELVRTQIEMDRRSETSKRALVHFQSLQDIDFLHLRK